MTQFEGKIAYINELAKTIKFLPHKYVDEVQKMLPEKSLHRIKNARSGIVQDLEVLRALKKIAEKERKRRQAAAEKELKATKLYA
jgi:hypothetical protein